ncbi:MAG: DUF3277 family protein [bacterium]|nr:DUF3277 family protein [bacterium]
MLKTYNGHEVSVIFGARLLTGLVEGDAVTIERDTDSWTDSVGLNGEVTRSGSADKRATVTIRLQQSSSDNDYCSGIVAADELAKSGVLPILVRDSNGNSIYAAPEAWIQKPTAATFGKEAGEREWVIRCAKVTMFSGGN